MHDLRKNSICYQDQFLVDRFKGFVLGGANTLLDLGQQAQVVPWFAEAVFWSFVSRFHPYSLRHPSRHRWDDHQQLRGRPLKGVSGRRKLLIIRQLYLRNRCFQALYYPFPP